MTHIQTRGAGGGGGTNGTNGVDAPTIQGTSTTSLAIGTGSKVFTTQSGKGWTVGQRLGAVSAGTPANYMVGVVASYSGTTLTLTVDETGGSGSPSDWNINVAGTKGTAGTNGTNGSNGTNGTNGSALMPRQLPIWYTDCLGVVSSVLSPYVPTAISSGTVAQVAPSALHPGVIRMTSSTTANSGERLQTDVQSLLMTTGDVVEVGFSCSVLTATTTIRLGFLDGTSSADMADGVYAEIVNATLSMKSASNSSRTTAGSTATLTAGTWYRAKFEMVGSAQADCTLYDDTGAVVLATQSITATLPTGAGRYTGVGVIATNSGTTATDLVDIDYISYSRAVASPLTR